MTRDVHAALARYGTDWSVERELHRVPPGATYEVVVDGRRAACKLAASDEGDPATEARVIERLARGTAVPVPRVLGVGEGSFVAEWSDSVPDGADERAAGYRMVNTVPYFRWLFLQGRHGPEGTARYAEWMRDRIRGELATLRGRYD